MSDKSPKTEAALEYAKKHRRKTILRRALIIVIAIVLVFTATPVGQEFWSNAFYAAGLADFRDPEDKPLLKLHFINVGDADALLIESKGETALLDAGYYDGGETTLNYLARQGVEKLDYAIISHPDGDHVGGMVTVLDKMPVGSFMQSEIKSSDDSMGLEYTLVREVLAKNDIPVTELAVGDTFTVGEAVCTVLAPMREYEDTNNTSLVIRLTYGSFSALFCGDVENDAEKDLVKSGEDIKADLLKVPHHGSDTSSTARFLEAVSPEYAVISTADIPKAEVQKRIEEYAELYRTDIDGNIVFSFDGENIFIDTEN